MRACLVLTAISLLSSGCWLSHGREDVPMRRDGGRLDGGPPPMPRDAGEIDLPDAGASGCEAWTEVEPIQVTTREGDHSLLDVEHTGPGYLMLWSTTNPSRDRSRFGTLLPLGGPPGGPFEIFDPPAPVSLGNSLAVGAGLMGATQSDENGCRFRRILDPVAPALGAEMRYPPEIQRCNGLLAHGGGFTAFDRERGEAHAFQPDGTYVRTRALEIFDGDVFWWARARQGDDAYLIATMRGGVEPTDARAQRVDRVGAPLGSPVDLLPFEAAATRIRATRSGPGVAVGWMQLREPGGQMATMRLFQTDLRGAPSPESHVYTAVRAYRDAGWSLVRIGDSLFLVYVEPEEGDRFGDRTALRAYRVSSDLAPLDPEPRTLATGRFLRRVAARTDGRDLFVGYTANDGTSTQVFAAGLRCTR